MNSPIYSFRLFCTAIALSLLSSCNETEVNAIARTDQLSSNAAIRIQALQIEKVELLVPILTTGTIRAQQVTNISPIVSGLVEKVFVDVGDRVNKGQPLFQLRQTEIDLQVKQLEHSLTLAKSGIS